MQKILILDLTRIHYMDQIAAKGFVSWADCKDEKQNHEFYTLPSIYIIAPPDGSYFFRSENFVIHDMIGHDVLFNGVWIPFYIYNIVL